MTRTQHVPTDGKNVRAWTHGQLPMPDWIPRHMAGGIEANGTFEIKTGVGHIRVHPGNVIVERSGAVWVCERGEADTVIERLELHADQAIPNIGPGKAHQFGSGGRSENKENTGNDRKKARQLACRPPIGSLPSIEWIQLSRLSVDSTYQRSTDNETSRRLITSIAAKFDWRLCTPLVVSRRSDDTLVIIDGQHRWMAVCMRSDIPQLPCCIFRYANIEEEARMFIVANRARKPISRLAFTSSIANAIRKFGPAITSAALTNMAAAFPNQKMTHGGAIFGGIVRIMSQPEPDFDPDQLVTVLQTRKADEWGLFAAGLHGGDRRVEALRDAIMTAYRRLSAAA